MYIGCNALSNNMSRLVWCNCVAGFNGDSLSAINTLIWYPWGLSMNNANTHLILGDRDNYRLRSLDISVADGAVSTILSGKEKADFSGGSNTPSQEVLMNSPEGMSFDAANDTMIWTDRNNCRIRSINTKTGLENVIVGAGCGNSDSEEEDPTDVYLRYAKDALVFNNGVIYSEQSWDGGNRNSQIRVLNRNASATTFFGTSVPAGKVSTIAGNFVLGAQNINNATWLSTYEGLPATAVSLRRPDGITTDGTNLYIADYLRHCILKVDPSGILTTFSGSCANAGLVNGPYNDSSIRYRYPSQIKADPQVIGGIFVADQIDRTTSRIRYINSTNNPVTIADQTIPANTVATIFDSERGSGVTAYQNWICFTSAHYNRADLGAHNVTCKDRTDSFGTTQFRIGPSGSSDRGAIQTGIEDEGVIAPGAKFYAPWKIEFDNEGNLYIGEYSAHTIRFVKKWW